MKRIRGALVTFALGCAAAPAAAQDGDGGRAEWRREAERIVSRLERIEGRLLESDAELRRLDVALGADLMAGILEADPALARDADRLPRLDAQMEAARQRGDSAALRRAETEMAGMQRRWTEAHARALRDPALDTKVRVFQALLRERMRETDPAAAGLLDRLEVLERRLARQAPR
jgi:hypothetical protein